MAGEGCVEQPLFGGAVSSAFPLRFQDLSNIRDVPDHQEAFADPSRDESIIFELLDLKHDVGDEGSAAWFLRDLAAEQDAESSMVLEHASAVEAFPLSYNGVPSTITTAIGQMRLCLLLLSSWSWLGHFKRQTGKGDRKYNKSLSGKFASQRSWNRRLDHCV